MSEKNESESSLGAFLAGFIIGGLVGAAVALILAPQSGEETRTQFTERSSGWRDRVNENRHSWSENVNQMAASASETLGGIDINSMMGRKDT
ncbi:MAG: gas vesicle protein, partial [Candidatus Promineifilaceae bacterium]